MKTYNNSAIKIKKKDWTEKEDEDEKNRDKNAFCPVYRNPNSFVHHSTN